jgi:hypothetical protein
MIREGMKCAYCHVDPRIGGYEGKGICEGCAIRKIGLRKYAQRKEQSEAAERADLAKISARAEAAADRAYEVNR